MTDSAILRALREAKNKAVDEENYEEAAELQAKIRAEEASIRAKEDRDTASQMAMLNLGTEDYRGVFTFKGGVKNGKGEKSWANGDEYAGELKDGIANGHGVYKEHDGSKYTGNMLDGKYHAKGEMVYKSGAKYDGWWKDGKREGKGTMIYVDGAKFVGDYKDDKRQGKGSYTYVCFSFF